MKATVSCRPTLPQQRDRARRPTIEWIVAEPSLVLPPDMRFSRIRRFQNYVFLLYVDVKSVCFLTSMRIEVGVMTSASGKSQSILVILYFFVCFKWFPIVLELPLRKRCHLIRSGVLKLVDETYQASPGLLTDPFSAVPCIIAYGSS